MNQSNIFRFEHLPNELIIYLFKYFHAEELFRCFYNLNNRFNKLIKLINYLCLIISQNNQYQIKNFHIFSSYLYTLIINEYLIFGHEAIRRIEGWQQLVILRVLKIGYIELLIFQTILSVCPNLNYFDLGIIIQSQLFSEIKSHINLKQLILRTSYNDLSKNENMLIFKNIFLCLPNLEKLSIHRNDNISIIKKYS
ncbi:unnamed protein product [Rotaria sordida]|uniref:F-box domain-containing protein n=1 Tax=Rotaria sordida TaxID=392033 RepID=A0A815NMU3_9BILA|nr:unnamed protein product [Rotaria sordida]CAF1440097.1 unnamed protein product [Rotaria sordida]